VKILFLNHNIIGRGTYWRCSSLARALVRAGHEVTLITTGDRVSLSARREKREGIDLWITPRLRAPGIHDGGWGLDDIAYRLGWVAGRRFDVIHAFGHRPNVALPWLLRRVWRRGARLFADWDDWWTRGGIITSRRRLKLLDTLEATLLEERIPRMAEGLTVASTCLRQRALDLGIPAERMVLLPQGANLEAIQPEDKRAARALLGLLPDGPVINFVGFAVWDVQVLLEAFSRVREKFPGALLQIIGTDKDGELPRLVAASPDQRATVQRGQVPAEQLTHYLAAADVQALPMLDRLDNRARWPIKIGDYLASGRPVVMQNVGDGAKVIAENDLGVVTGQSAEEFAKGIIELLSDPQRAGQIGRRARQYAERHMRWEDRAKVLLEFYKF